jgi:hypothetical protein
MRSHTEVHLGLSEEDHRPGLSVVSFGCKGITIELLIKEVILLSQIMVY